MFVTLWTLRVNGAVSRGYCCFMSFLCVNYFAPLPIHKNASVAVA